jgi:hypothetical protein
MRPRLHCVSGSCACSMTTCGSSCVDLQADSQNCGRCGHSCQGGQCGSGVCQRMVLASGETTLGISLSVDSSYVYYTTATAVKRVPVLGGSATVFASDQPGHVATDGTTVYCHGPTQFWNSPPPHPEDRPA